jgi:hypothetical protein
LALYGSSPTLTFAQVIAGLRAAAVDPERSSAAFQDLYDFALVEEKEFERLPEPIQGILSDFAFDLDYYEPDSEARQEHPSFYGPTRAVYLIESALSQLHSEGAV